MCRVQVCVGVYSTMNVWCLRTTFRCQPSPFQIVWRQVLFVLFCFVCHQSGCLPQSSGDSPASALPFPSELWECRSSSYCLQLLCGLQRVQTGCSQASIVPTMLSPYLHLIAFFLVAFSSELILEHLPHISSPRIEEGWAWQPTCHSRTWADELGNSHGKLD